MTMEPLGTLAALSLGIREAWNAAFDPLGLLYRAGTYALIAAQTRTSAPSVEALRQTFAHLLD